MREPNRHPVFDDFFRRIRSRKSADPQIGGKHLREQDSDTGHRHQQFDQNEAQPSLCMAILFVGDPHGYGDCTDSTGSNTEGMATKVISSSKSKNVERCHSPARSAHSY